MTEILLAIQTLLSAPNIDKSKVESLLHVQLKESQRNPYWIYFLGQGKESLVEVDFRRAISGEAWLVALTFDIAKSPPRAEVPLDKYGPLADLRPNPDIPPEGTTSYVYYSKGVRVSFSFTARTQKLYEIVLRADPPP